MSGIAKQTLYFDTERSGYDYISDYDNFPGVQGPLWHDRKIPVLGVTGEIGQGKTTFMLDIACGPVEYMDIPAKMVQLYPEGYRSIHVYMWWSEIIKKIRPGKFRVIALDVAEEIEAGLAEWVWENPLHFNHTKAQYIGMPAIYQNDITSLWKATLTDLSARCETFTFANHMGHVWGDKKPTGERKAKGRPVLKQLASMIVKLERKKDAAGNVPAKPSGTIDLDEGGKARLRRRINGEWMPILPPRLPVATPDAIRAYILTPPDYRNLKPEERSPEKVITEDDRCRMRKEAAEAEGNAASLKMQLLAEERRHPGRADQEQGEEQAAMAEQSQEAASVPQAEVAAVVEEATVEPEAKTEAVVVKVEEPGPAKPVETLTTQEPAPTLSPTAITTTPPASTSINPAGDTYAMLEELLFLKKVPSEKKEAVTNVILSKVDAKSVSTCTVGQHEMLQQILITAISKAKTDLCTAEAAKRF